VSFQKWGAPAVRIDPARYDVGRCDASLIAMITTSLRRRGLTVHSPPRLSVVALETSWGHDPFPPAAPAACVYSSRVARRQPTAPGN